VLVLAAVARARARARSGAGPVHVVVRLRSPDGVLDGAVVLLASSTVGDAAAQQWAASEQLALWGRLRSVAQGGAVAPSSLGHALGDLWTRPASWAVTAVVPSDPGAAGCTWADVNSALRFVSEVRRARRT
jgi:hypothetical protein